MAPHARITVVTGASSGIGAATAIELARRGYALALGARRAERIDAVAKQILESGGRAFAHPLDVTEPASADAFCAAVEANLGPIEVLINNAGQNLSAQVADATDEQLRLDLEINLLGPMYMTRRVLPGMLARRAGDVVFLGSDSALRPRTYQGAYSAAKAGLETFARVVEMETEGSGVRSILMRVGPTGSEFGSRMPADQLPAILASWKYWGTLRHLHWMPAESVAPAIANTLDVPVEESYPTVVEVMPGGRIKPSDG